MKYYPVGDCSQIPEIMDSAALMPMKVYGRKLI